MNRPSTICAAFLCAVVPLCSPAADTTMNLITAPAFDGGQLQFDGMYYDYRDPLAQRAIKLWVPPGEEPVRGIIFHGNPGGGEGDTRPLALDQRLQEFAARHRFGIIGVTWFRGGEIYRQTAQIILNVLDGWAKMGVHPELANVPLIPRGSSNAGVTSYSFTCFAPERMVCFTPNVGPSYTPREPSDAALKVPGLLHIGPADPFFPMGVKATAELFCNVRPRGALWAWDAEEGKGHEIRHVDDVDLKFYDTCIGLRLPPDADPRKGQVTLIELAATNGWLADTDSWSSRRGGGGATYIAPYAQYDAERTHPVWLPTEDIAVLYRAIATYGNPLEISIRDIGTVENPDKDGALLRSVGGNVVDPGTRIVVECDASKMRDWERIEFRDGAELLGTVKRGGKAECTFVVDGAKRVYALVALGYDDEGRVRTSFPLHFIVRDPAVAAALQAQRAAHAAAERARTRVWKSEKAAAPAPDTADAALVAHALTPAQEKQFGAAEGAPAAFWSADTGKYDTAVLRASIHAAKPATPGQDELVRAHAAYSHAGLYLYFELIDAAPGPGAEMDFHLARESAATLFTGSPLEHFTVLQSTLALSESQYHAPFGAPEKPGAMLVRNVPFPWHMAPRTQSFDAARKEDGIIVRQVNAGGRRGQEWFLPWSQVGIPGACDAPEAGTRIGCVIGYNSDEGENAVSLRWPHGVDPWAHSYQKGPNPNPWGDIVLGPVME